jgi:hypothetical protein
MKHLAGGAIASVGKGLGGLPSVRTEGVLRDRATTGGWSDPYLVDAARREHDSNSSKGLERPKPLQCYARERRRRFPMMRRSVTNPGQRWPDIQEAFLECGEGPQATDLRRLPLSGQFLKEELR